MSNRLFLLLAVAPLAAACGSSIPEPKQPMADAVAASRSARELGADGQPTAKLHVQLADEQIEKARQQIAAGENGKATSLLLRATADAELALALSREQSAIADKQKAVEQSTTTRATDTPASKP